MKVTAVCVECDCGTLQRAVPEGYNVCPECNFVYYTEGSAGSVQPKGVVAIREAEDSQRW